MSPSPPAVRLQRAPFGPWGLVLALELGGCTLVTPAPTIEAVEPAWGYNGETTDVEIVGEHFFPTVIVTERGAGEARIEDSFQAWLVQGEEKTSLGGVSHVGYDRLRAQVPEGLEPGDYDIEVEVPSGLTATLADAFSVTDTRADHLVLDVDTPAYVVGDIAEVYIYLQDPADQTVPQDLEVVVTTSEDVEGIEFYGGLDDQEELQGQTGVRGRLEPDGTGVVTLGSSSAGAFEINVAAVDNEQVDGDSLPLSWAAGPVHEIELDLPRDSFRVQAGDTFKLDVRLLDSLGNVLTNESTRIWLRDTCSNWLTTLTVTGEATVDVTLEEACAIDTLQVTYDTEQYWSSDPFVVLPGDIDGYTVVPVAEGESVTAGEQLPVIVEAVDRFGNVLEDHTTSIELRDDVGGLDPDLGKGEQTCGAFTLGVAYCTATLWKAGTAVTITAEDAVGESGDAEPIEVLPADAASVIVLPDESTVEAGQPFSVSVRLLDEFGNTVEFDPGGSEPVAWADDSGTIACTWIGPDEGAQVFSCSIEGAVADANVTATLVVLGLVGEAADPLTVENGPLAVVDLEPNGSTFTAGTAFTLELRGFDAYGNAYIVQSDPRVDLDDSAGTMTPRSAVLGPLGTVQVSAVIYGAGSAVKIYGSQGGTLLGTSRAIPVGAAEMDSFAITAPPWIVVDEGTGVDVTAIDPYGNTIEDYNGEVALSSAGGSCEATTADTFVDGVASVEITCPTPALSETLVAVDEDFVGTSATLDVVDLACADGPTADLTVDGDSESVRCVAEGGSVDVDVDTSGSTAGGSAITVRHFVDGENTPERSLSADTTYTYDEPGTRYVEALVVDSRACADLAGAYVWVGLDDGEPTGTVDVSLSASTVTSTGTVTATVTAQDCTEDLAAGQTLYVRSDLGQPEGTSTGAGLAVTLDSSGSASFDWVFDAGFDGTATLYAGSASGGAIGSATIDVTQDAILPEVVSVTPSGVELGTISEVVIVFSEAMLSNNVSVTYISLTAPDGSPVDASYDLSDDATTVTITPYEPLDGSAGRYTLSLSRNLRDLVGNQLDGGFSDTRAPFTGIFGDVGSTLPEVTSCDVDPETFVPDGDDGVSGEEDATTVTPTATSAPTWWWLLVEDTAGTRVRSLRAAGSDTEVAWDGRGDDGIVAESGRYRLNLMPIDTYGNVGEGCDVTVELQQHVDVP